MIDLSTRRRLEENWQRVREQVERAATSAGRSANEIRIVGVSKYVDTETTAALFEAGCHALGESRPQELWKKAEQLQLGDHVRWHLIGHLQRNKIRRTLRHHPCIHSIDSQRLLTAVADEAAGFSAPIDLLLEVNISGDDAKTGFAVDDLESVVNTLPERGVRVLGLMAMAGWGTDPAEAQRQFAAARQLRDRLAHVCGRELPELSMGMSGDFEAAIAEGATIVRIGSSLFEGIPRK